jgi:iron complex outermembrane receptor protein
VTKKPVDTLGGEVSFTTGSYGLRRLSADVYGPADLVDKDKKLLFRMNAAYQDQKSFQDAGFRKSIFFAPSLEYRANKRLNISVNAGFYQLEGTSPSVIFLNRTRNYIAKVPGDLNFDWNRSYTNNDLTMRNPTLNFRGQVTYKLSDHWTSQTIYSINSRKSDGFYQYQFIRGAKDNVMERTLSKQYSINISRDLQQNFTGDFNLFGLRNRVVVGFDYLNQTVHNNSSPYIVFDSVDGANPADANYGKINRSAVEAGLAKSTGLRTWNNGENNIYGAYASNVLNLSERLMAMLSLRVDRFQNKGSFNLSNNQRTGQYVQTAVSPKLGLVYQVLKDRISLFGNYMNGFSNVAPVTQPEGSGASSTFKPQQSNQFEGGAKMDLFQGKLSFTASVYDIEVKNMTWREDITVNGKNYPVTLQGGTQKSKGVELELIANPVQGLNIIAGYAYNDSKLIEGTPALEGRRPAFAGPSVLINSWISYAIPGGYLKGLGLGTGVNYIGKHITGNSAITGVFTLPSYVMATATVFYDKPKYRLGFKVDNLTDELYFTGIGVLSPQVPRTFAANATFKF